MRANKPHFDKIKQRYDLLMAKSAYILAEIELQRTESANFENDIKYFIENEDGAQEMTPEEFSKLHEPLRSEDSQLKMLKHQIKGLEDLGRELLNEEKYEEMQECKELWEKLNEELKKLKNGI